jgi:hypothetical protein
MSSEDTLIGNELRLQIGDGNSPQVFTDFCAITDVGGLGESKPQIDVTALCDLARKFRAGLKEGNEVTLTANLIQGDQQTRDLFASYGTDEIVDFRYTMVGVSPEEYFQFSGAILSWGIAGPSGERATMTFTVKITGEVDWVYV